MGILSQRSEREDSSLASFLGKGPLPLQGCSIPGESLPWLGWQRKLGAQTLQGKTQVEEGIPQQHAREQTS